MTISEWDSINKWLDLDDIIMLIHLVEEQKDADVYGTVLDKLNTIISEVIPS